MENDEELILRECREISEAMVHGDTDVLTQLIAADVVRHANGMTQPIADWLQDLEEGTLRYYQIDCERTEIKISGIEAIMTGRLLLEASVYGVKGNWKFPIQIYFRKQDENWNVTKMNYSNC